eukprot:scaffold227321_cov17-Prasinocladus_malaysianus.AAC.2
MRRPTQSQSGICRAVEQRFLLCGPQGKQKVKGKGQVCWDIFILWQDRKAPGPSRQRLVEKTKEWPNNAISKPRAIL